MESLCRAEDDVAVDVVLEVLVRLVADAHRTHAPVSRQVRNDRLGQGLLQADAVERLDVTRLRAAQHVVEPAKVVLHGSDLGQAVQRADDEERVPQPAKPIVPVAPAVRRFRNACRHGGDDGARLLELTKLQGDGSANHRFLPLQGKGETARPGAPVESGLLLEFPGGLVDASRERLVGTEQQAHGRVQREPGAFDDVGGRRARRQPQRAARKHVAQMVAAACDHRPLAGPLAEGPDADADARVPRQRTDPANQLRRAEHPVAMEEPRREVRDLHASPRVVEQAGTDDCGAVVVALLDPAQAFELDAHPSIGRALGKQGVEHRIAVEPGHAAPDDGAAPVDEGADRTVADERQIEVRFGTGRRGGRRVHVLFSSHGFTGVEHSDGYAIMANSRRATRVIP